MRRAAWGCAKTLLRPVPQFCYNVRNQMLCPFGAQTGRAVRIYPSADLRE